MAVLVTGAGLVGSYIAKILVERGEKPILYEVAPNLDFIGDVVNLDQVKIIRGDLLDFPDLLRAIEGEKVDRVIHTAGLLTLGVSQRPYAGIKANVLGTANILEAARLMGIKRVIFTSSATVYLGIFSEPQEKPIEEDYLFGCLTGRPRSVYATTKLACEYLGLNYADIYNIDFVAVRYGALFGPWKGSFAGIAGIMAKAIIEKAALNRKVIIDDPTITWQGKMEFVYVKDAAKATTAALYADGLKERIFNISMGKLYSFQEVMDITKKIFPGTEFEIKEMAKGVMASYPFVISQPSDISSARRDLSYEPEYDMEKAFEDYRDWLKHK